MILICGAWLPTKRHAALIEVLEARRSVHHGADDGYRLEKGGMSPVEIGMKNMLDSGLPGPLPSG